MIIYESDKAQFMKYVEKGIISDVVYDYYCKKVGNIKASEILAWRNSLRNMYSVLNTDAIPNNAGIAIEYMLPYQYSRIDFIVTGKDNFNSDHVIIIELKQWTEAKAISDKHLVETYVGGGNRELTHPSYQAWSYAETLKEYNKTVQDDNIQLHPCSFLHNYVVIGNDALLNNEIYPEITDAPVFTRDDAKNLQNFILKYIKSGDTNNIIFRIDSGKLKPSKSLQDSIAKMLEGNREFIMLDSQKMIYENIMYYVNHMKYEDNKKIVIIVKGGPGTGKSVLAINLLADIINSDKSVAYVTKNSAPRNVYFKKLSKNFKKNVVNNLFKSSGIFYDSPKNAFDILLVDEAHRLNEKSGLFSNKGENQIKEIINASRISVFFIDEDQIVTSKDIGSIDLIKSFAKQLNAKIKTLELISQFRCNGSDDYIIWLNNLLEIRINNYDIFNNKDYDFKVFDNLNEMYEAIYNKNKLNNKSRIVAGYCWDWVSKKDINEFDINIPLENFRAQWNFSNTSTWAIDENSIDQVGCIHTSQGLEFDYIGVIIGDDLRYDGQKVITDFSKRARTDKSLSGLVTKCRNGDAGALKKADRIIRNTYKTLLTRGMKGCYVYCTDKKLSNYIKSRIHKSQNIYDTLNHNILLAAEEQEEYKY